MRNRIKFLLILCLAISICVIYLFVGREKEKSISVNEQSYMYKEIVKSNTPCTSEEIIKIENGVNEWAKIYLLYSSSDIEDAKIIDKALCDSIVSKSDREKVKDDRKKLYKDYIVIKNVKTHIISAFPANYKGKMIGYVDCTIKFKGNINNDDFSRKYNLKLLIDYHNDIVSIYEIGKINWS